MNLELSINSRQAVKRFNYLLAARAILSIGGTVDSDSCRISGSQILITLWQKPSEPPRSHKLIT